MSGVIPWEEPIENQYNMARKVVKIFFSEEDLQDMQGEQKDGLWNTWTGKTDCGENIDVELHLGQED
jgi:hypothetical protein